MFRIPTIRHHAFRCSLFLLFVGVPLVESSAAHKPLDLPLTDATGVTIEGPHRFLDVDGKSGLHLTSLKSRAVIDTSLHQLPRESLSFWMLSLEDLSKYSIHSKVYCPTGNPTSFHLVSDSRSAIEKKANDGMFWRTGYPQCLARFAQGRMTVFDVIDDPFKNNGPVLDFGRIGLRQMYKTTMRYRDFVVYEREPSPEKTTKRQQSKMKTPSKPTLLPTYADIPYGPHERNVLDFWQAKGKGPRPLLVAIHGGGWTNGDKAKRRSTKLIQSFLDQGISYATINYRYTRQAILPGPVHDAARAIQFLRTKSAEWNIKESRIAVTGGSAGACSSMWILLHDDLADPTAEDIILRESSRVCAAAVWEGQVSLDPKRLVEWLGPNILQHRMLYLSVGERTIDAALANYKKHRALYDEFAPYNHVDGDDPPLFMSYKYSVDVPCKDGNHGIHHPVMGVKMKEKSDQVGHECHLILEGVSKQGAFSSRAEFLRAKLLNPQ